MKASTISLSFVLIAAAFGFYYQDNISDILNPFLPNKLGSVSTQKKEPTAEELALTEQKRQKAIAEQKQELQISQLFKDAELHFESGRLIEPSGQNALEQYQKVLDIVPENIEAEAGINRIFDFYLDSVEDLMKKQEFARVESLLQRAEVVKPGSVKLRLARVHLTDAKNVAERIAKEAERVRLKNEKRELEVKRLAENKQQELKQERKKLAEEKLRKEEAEKRAELERQKEIEATKQRSLEKEKQQYTKFIKEAEQAIDNKDKELAISKYRAALAIYPNDRAANNGMTSANKLLDKVCYGFVGTWVRKEFIGESMMKIRGDGVLFFGNTEERPTTWVCHPEQRQIKENMLNTFFTLSEDGTCMAYRGTGGDTCYRKQ